jgi:putative intracellular protease/amidase
MQGESMSAAVLLYEGCTITEVAEIATRLTNWDVPVHFVAPSVEELRDQSGLLMRPDHALGDVDPSGLTVVIVPGGNPDTVSDDPAVPAWLRRADEAGVLVAAICAGVSLVASAGLVAGRRITHNVRTPWAPPELADSVAHLWVGAMVEEDRTVGVVRDGNLISALPNAPVEFAMEILVAVGLYDRRRAELMGAHLKGGYVEQLYLGG